MIFNSKSGIKGVLEELLTDFLELGGKRPIECLRALTFKPIQKNFVNIVFGSNGGLALSKGVENEYL